MILASKPPFPLLSCSLLSKVDLLVPSPPDLGGCEHATGTAHVTECCLTSTVSTTSGDTRNTCDSAAWRDKMSALLFPSPLSPRPQIVFRTYQFPKTRQRSGDLPSRSRHMAASCSWPCRCGRFCGLLAIEIASIVGEVVLDNVRADWCLEDIGKRVSRVAGLAIGANDGDNRSA